MASSPTPKHGAKITYEDALAYTRLVEDTFRGPKYEEFVEILDEFRAKRITLDGLVTRMKVLFKGHEELILGLITFLPPGCELKLKEENNRGWPTTQGSLHFLNKIKDRFNKENDVYKKFLHAIKAYRANPSKSLRELYKEVVVLFKDHDDLLREFTNYLPDTLAASRDDVPRLSTSTATSVKFGRTGVDGDDDLPIESTEGVTVGQYNLRWFPGRRYDPSFPPSYNLRSGNDDVPCLSTSQSTATDSDDSDDDFSIYSVKRVAVGRHQLRPLPGRRSDPPFPPSYNLQSRSDGAHYPPDTPAASRDDVPCLSTSQPTAIGGTDSDNSDDDLSTESVEGVVVGRYQLRRLPGRRSDPPFPQLYNLRSRSDDTHYPPDTLTASRDDVPCLSTSQSLQKSESTETDRTDSDDSDDDLSIKSVEGVAVRRYQLRRLPGRQSGPPFPPSYNLRSRSDGDH